MPGVFGVFPFSNEIAPRSSLLETIDPTQSCESSTTPVDDALLAVSWLVGSPLQKGRHPERYPYTAVLAGDLPGTSEPPWETIIRGIESGEYSAFARLRGPFALGIYDSRKKKVFLVSDRTSQHPLYYSVTPHGFAFSTTLATFCWLYDVLYFNYPIGQTTFLVGVRRMPAASVLEFDRVSGQLALRSYARRFVSPSPLIDGEEAIHRAHAVLEERIPDYFEPRTSMALSLTAGFDGRTVASYMPSDVRGHTETYTYGVPGCEDLVQAAKLACVVGSHHTEILFDHSFLDELPTLAYQTVYLSHGLQRINRSTLTYAYRTLKQRRPDVQAILTGISGDHLFRDHIAGFGNVPSIISPCMMRTIQTGERPVETFRPLVGPRYGGFERHIHDTLDELTSRLGDLSSPEGYLSYLIYETAPKYFGAEAAIASNHMVLRTPYWDADVVQLAYEISFGTLGLSRNLPGKDLQKESLLQASLIRRRGILDQVPVAHIPVDVWAQDSRFVYQLHRILRRGPRRLLSLVGRRPIAEAEDWSRWYATVLKEELESLVSGDSLVAKYIEPGFVSRVREENDRGWLGKLATVEIVLRLIEKRWSL
jgi:asparagine synthetase B (glutamine-hydrolysing)